jgi:hypothetical protein
MDLKKELGGVADAVTKIMMDEKALHPNQQKLDVHEPEKDELTADDFKKLRAGKKAPEVKKEEVEEIDELDKSTLGSYIKKASKDIAKHTIATRDYGDKAGKSKKHSDFVDNAMASVKSTQKADKRQDNIAKAVNRLTKEEVEELDEAPSKESMEKAASDKKIKHEIAADRIEQKQKNMMKKAPEVKKEEVEQIDEVEIVKTATGMRVYGSSYGDSAKARRDQVKKSIDTSKGPKMKELSDIEAEKKKKKKMSEMVATYQEQGLKGLFASLVKEEPDNEQFTKELEAQKAKNAGQGKKAEVAKAEVLAVQEEEFEVVMNEPNGYAEATIEERSMTEPEIKKKEEIVKSMKKGISGFKERYGSRAKNVMYATATKRAMGEEVEQIEEGTPEGYQRRDGKLIPKIHPTMTPHEHGYDYTMQSIEDAPSKAKIHSQHKEIVKDNPHPQGSKEHKDWEAGTNKAKADHLKDFS